MRQRPKIVIIGAGFGGMQAAQSLAKSSADVLLIDRNNYNTFVPLLYQVAAAQIEPDLIAYPIRTILHRASNVRFLMADVNHIDIAHQVIETDNGLISYDYLVLATGSRVQYLGVSGAADYAFPLRTLAHAIALRHHLLQRFEQAVREPDPVRRQQLLTVAIVGGGATGVEVAGTLVELQRTIAKDYPSLDMREMQIILIQSGDYLLPDLPPRLGRYTAKVLQRLGITLYFQTRVNRITQNIVQLQNGTSLVAGTVVWAVGLEGAIPDTDIDPQTGRKQKIAVRSTLQLHDHDNVYAIGDAAHVQLNGKSLTGVAPEALQQGVAVARNLRRQIRGKAPKPFRYFDKGRLAIIGCYAGVGKIGPFYLTGFLPWLMWLSVHLVYLPGVRNRLLVLLNWLHGYGLGRRAIRLILPLTTQMSQPSEPQPQPQHAPLALVQVDRQG